MVFAFAGDSTITSVLEEDFFPDVFAFLVLFVLDGFVLDADVSVANPSVPFNAPIGVHFILCDNSFQLHLKQEEGDICRPVLRHTV